MPVEPIPLEIAERILSMGNNVPLVHPWTTAWTFKNWAKQATHWVRCTAGTWDELGEVTGRNDNGYPTTLAGGEWARSAVQVQWWDSGTRLIAGNGGMNERQFPEGAYVFTYTGNGTITLDGTGLVITDASAGRIEFTAESDIHIRIESLGAVEFDDFVICEAKYEGDWENKEYWYPELLTELSGFKWLRFSSWFLDVVWDHDADFMTWEQRRPIDYYCYFTQPFWDGIDAFVAGKDARMLPWELHVNLCNTLNTNLWVVLPAKAGDAFVTSLFTHIETNLNEGLKIILEYSNEPFFDGEASITENVRWMYEQGVADPEIEDHYQEKWYVKRANQVYTLAQAAAPTRTITKVLTSDVVDRDATITDWFDTISAEAAAQDYEFDTVMTSLYPPLGSITEDGYGGYSKADWLDGTVNEDIVNDIYDASILVFLAELDIFALAVAVAGYKMGFYEFGLSLGVNQYGSMTPAEADTIGDVLRSTHETPRQYRQLVYMLNHFNDYIEDEPCVYFQACVAPTNTNVWYSIDDTEDTTKVHNPRLRALREFIWGNAMRYRCVQKCQHLDRVWSIGEIGVFANAPGTNIFELYEGDILTGRQSALSEDMDGTMYFGKTGWKTIRFPAIQQNIPAAGSHLAYNHVEKTVDFDSTSTAVDNEGLHFSVLIPTDWKINTNILPYIRWWQSQAELPAWKIYTRVYEMLGGTKPGSWTLHDVPEPEFNYDSGTISNISLCTAIDMSALGHGAILECRLVRVGADDSYVGDALLSEFGVFYQVDSFGSGRILTK